MSEILYDVSVAGIKELLDGDGHYVVPSKILCDLDEDQARAAVPGSPCSIGQIVSHMHFCQQGEIAGARGWDWPFPERLDDTFAPVPPGGWNDLVASFLAGIEEVKRLADEKAGSVCSTRGDTTVGYDLAGTALHNAYHFGQIVLLRRMMGLWPPAGGDDNDY